MPRQLSSIAFLCSLILLNLVPVYGVFNWGWKTFDLIFLYWLENLFIGLFILLRMLASANHNRKERAMALFLSAFFTLHYGLFCSGHGEFVLHLFDKNITGISTDGWAFSAILPVIEARHLWWAVLALFAYQLLDWVRGLSAMKARDIKDIKTIMFSPYHRIMVLHVTIIGAGFLLSLTNEPVAGLLLLVAIKIANDIYRWRKGNLSRDLQAPE